MTDLKIIGAKRSHFTRKVRLLLDFLDIDYAFMDMGDVSNADPALFGQNPLMSVPVLYDGDVMRLDSDHIAAYLVHTYNPADAFDVLTRDPSILNARAILNGAMAAEVRLVLAERTGLPTAQTAFFDKARSVIANALDWCEANASLLNHSSPTYLSFHFISFWDHVNFYKLANGEWPALDNIAGGLRELPRVRRSAIPA